MIKYVTQGKRSGKFSAPEYVGRYKLRGMSKIVEVPLHCTDKRIATEKLDAIVDELEREAAGIIAPKPLRDAAQRTMADHLKDFIADLTARQRAPMYVYNAQKHVAKLIEQCNWTWPKDVTGDSFLTWRAGQHGKAAKTLNGYLDFATALLKWMTRQGRLVANPLAGVGRVETKGKEKRKRRALGDAELRRLMAVAGPRSLAYLALVHTGLRRAELAKLQWGDVHLDSPVPFIQARSATTKNGKDAVIGLPRELVDGLRLARPEKVSASAPVFKRVPSMEVYRDDLTAAGIEYKDAQGRQADLHALRKTLCTSLNRLGVAPRVAMEVMRHSEISLTMKDYTDTKGLPTLEVAGMLPQYMPVAASELAATGTESKQDANTQGKIHPQIAPQLGVRLGRELSQQGTESTRGDSDETPEIKAKSRDLSHQVAASMATGKTWGTRIRT